MFKSLLFTLRTLWIRVSRYEYWAWWMFFLPLFPQYLYYAIRLRNPVYFTASNPGIEFGGFFGEKKNEIMAEIPESYLVKSLFFESVDLPSVEAGMRIKGIDFPIIVKPNVGERGDEVVIVENRIALEDHLSKVHYPFIVQEFVRYPIELGVFYSRLPSERRGRILSVVSKKFLHVVGDGHTTVKDLLKKTSRGSLQIRRLQKERPELLAYIPPMGESRLVEPIGNHCFGTEFINDNHLINARLNEVFDDISVPFKGFYFGRYDLKVESIDQMYKGESIRIFELNGVTSEPGHIFDRRMNLFEAYRDLIRQQAILFEICRQNLENDEHITKSSEIVKRAYQHFFKAKR